MEKEIKGTITENLEEVADTIEISDSNFGVGETSGNFVTKIVIGTVVVALAGGTAMVCKNKEKIKNWRKEKGQARLEKKMLKCAENMGASFMEYGDGRKCIEYYTLDEVSTEEE